MWLPGYDEWKTTPPADNTPECKVCGDRDDELNDDRVCRHCARQDEEIEDIARAWGEL